MHVPRSLTSADAKRPRFVTRPRRRRTWTALPLGVLLLLGIGAVVTDQTPAAFSGDAVDPAAEMPRAAPQQPPEAPAAPTATPPFASFGDLDLHLPTGDPVVVGFHEASSDHALRMRPVGSVVENENTTKFVPPGEVEDGADYLVLSSRGRVHAATSAVDVVMRVDDPVRSPVHGTVADVRQYHLYGSHEDYRLEISPTANPELRVVLIHLDDMEVSVGDEVVAGESVLAGTARPFPFGSQIDRYTEPDRWPHVHLEVKHEDHAGGGEDEVEE